MDCFSENFANLHFGIPQITIIRVQKYGAELLHDDLHFRERVRSQCVTLAR